MQRSARVFHIVARGVLVLLAAVIPLVYLPWTFDALEVNKQTLLIVGVIIAALCWFGGAVIERRVVFRKDWLFVAFGGFLLLTLFSALSTDAPYLSLVGHSEQEYTSFLSYVMFGVLFFLGAHYLADTPIQRRLSGWLLIVSGVLSALMLPSFFGWQLMSTNLIGSPSAWGMYLVAMTVLGSGLWLTSGGGDRNVLPNGVMGFVVRVGYAVTAVTTLCATVAIDSTALWLALITGMGTLFVFAFVRAHEFPHFGRFIVPMLFFVVALVLLFVPTFVGSPFVAEIGPAQGASWHIATSTLADGNALLGSGPGTYTFDYTKHRALELNSVGDFWDVRFDRASSFVLTMLPTFGVLGTVAYLAIIVGLFATALSRLVVERNHEEWKMTFAPFAAWMALVVAQFVMPSNFTLQVLFWVLSAVLAGQVIRRVAEVNSVKSPRAGLAASFAFVLVLIILVATLFVTVSRYRAEIAFARAVTADRADAPLEDVIMDLDRAALRNRWSDVYYRNLGRALLLKTAEVINDPDASPSQIQELIGASVNAARRATTLSPNNVINWQLLGDIYREVTPLIGDADVFAIASYERAIALAPNSPKYYVSLARGYLAQADLAARLMDSDDEATASAAKDVRVEALANAVTALESAKTLKPDYASAQYFLALVYERQEKLSDAIASMEALRTASPLDIGISLQLSLLYLRQGKNDLAKEELQRSLEIEPNFANAHWYLASIYQQEDDFAAAIKEIEAIAKTDPDNTEVAQRLAQLQQGLEESQLPPPIEETPADGTTDATEETSP